MTCPSPHLLLDIRGPNDYVADVKFSPSHPALFACAHAGGTVALWDLSRGTSVSEPVDTTLCRERGEGTLNTLEWSPDGRRLFCGDSTGDVYELTLQKDVATANEEEIRRAEANVLVWQGRAASQKAMESKKTEVQEDDF